MEQMRKSLIIPGVQLLSIAHHQTHASGHHRRLKEVHKTILKYRSAFRTGQGRGPRNMRKDQSVEVLSGQLLRLRERLVCEPELSDLNEAITIVLELLGVF